MRPMDFYAHERQILDRHEARIQAAEERSRLQGWDRSSLAEHVATQLRRLADRIEGRQPTRVWIHPG